MKKILLPILIFALFFSIGCGGSKKGGTDNDLNNDGDAGDTEISDENGPESENQDEDEPETVVPEEDQSNDEDTVKDPCENNKCGYWLESTGVCIPEDNGRYSCECRENYSWNGSNCTGDKRTAKCTDLPENAFWNNYSEITQTWKGEGEGWKPETTGCYDDEYSSCLCTFECKKNYFWNGSKCVNPCDSDPCANQPHSTGSCTPVNSFQYICSCEENLYWWGQQRGCTAQRPVSGNLCTGQFRCYDLISEIECPAVNEDFYGQDAHYAELGSCAPQDFAVDNEFPEEPVVVSRNTGLEWVMEIPEETESWEEAAVHCENLTYAGKDDWRLPTLRELLSTVNNNDTIFNPDENFFTGKTSSSLWSSDEYAGRSEKYAWSTYTFPVTVTSESHVLCVRGEKFPAADFESLDRYGDEIVTDSATGLMWQKDYVKDKNWKQALNHCESLIYAGYSDWRVPNKNELMSLVDHLKVGPASDFPGEIGEYPSHAEYLSSSSMNGNYAWITDLTDGVTKYSTKYDEDHSYNDGYIRCVRSDICEEGYFLHGKECVKNPCTADSCGMEHSTGVCIPETETTYKCLCTGEYIWNGSACVDPCDTDPCSGISNSNGICTAVNAGLYFCGCKEGYTWSDGKCGTFAENVKTLGNICTGQDKCYNNTVEISCPNEGMVFHGQDAGYASSGKCTKQSLKLETASNQKTITDNNTGLVWQQALSKKSFTWNDALAYCEELEYAGFSDWRLPEPQEILTIVDYGRSGIRLNKLYFTDIPEKSSGNAFWTSKTFKDDPESAWTFSPQSGALPLPVSKTDIYHVMCVRGKKLPTAKFEKSTKNGDTVAVDLSSGLMWQQDYAEPESEEWMDALKYCEDLTFAGYSDWRLPNKNELASIISYDASDEYGTFLTMPESGSYDFWSSTTHYARYFNAETEVNENDSAVTLDYQGILSVSDKKESLFIKHYVRCVR